MLLIEPTMEYDQPIQDFRREYLEDGGSMDGGASLRKYDDTRAWLDQLEPLTSQFIYVREEDRRVVGVIQIRHRFNEFLEKYAGHIGYCVRPSERRKGYATRMLALALRECARLGINDVLVCCLEDNEASRRTILANGGVYESTVLDPGIAEYILDHHHVADQISQLGTDQCQDRNERVSERILDQGSKSGDTAGLCSLHEVLIQASHHGSPDISDQDRCSRKRKNKSRQDRISDPFITGRRQPSEFHGNQHDQHDPHPVIRHGLTDHCHDRKQFINEFVRINR